MRTGQTPDQHCRLFATKYLQHAFGRGCWTPAALAGIALLIFDWHRPIAIWLTGEQKRAYAGNAITLSNDRVWMSMGAAVSLTDMQRESLAPWGFRLGAVSLSEIEKAGGSLR